jgi:hypothetical protein
MSAGLGILLILIIAIVSGGPVLLLSLAARKKWHCMVVGLVMAVLSAAIAANMNRANPMATFAVTFLIASLLSLAIILSKRLAKKQKLFADPETLFDSGVARTASVGPNTTPEPGTANAGNQQHGNEAKTTIDSVKETGEAIFRTAEAKAKEIRDSEIASDLGAAATAQLRKLRGDDNAAVQLREAKKLFEEGLLSETEFDEIRGRLVKRLGR